MDTVDESPNRHTHWATKIESVYPLSPLQQGMVFHRVFGKGAGVDTVQVVADLREAVNFPAFETSWQLATVRHAVLRTAFRWENLDQPRQEVHEPGRVRIERRDWSSFPPVDQCSFLENWLRQDRQRGFNLRQPPLMRLALIRVAEDQSWFIWTFHHALLDARSFTLVLQEVFQKYDALCAGHVLTLETPPAYREHIEWLQRQDWSKAETYWRNRLKGFNTPTVLTVGSTDASRPEGESEPAEHQMDLSRELSEDLKSFALRHGLTTHTLIQAAWAVSLSRYSGQDDVVFGAVRACRHSSVPVAESMVGLLINTVPVRVSLNRDTGLLPWLHALREHWVELRTYEQTPLVNVQRWSELPNTAALFETLVNYHPKRWQANLEMGGPAGANRKFRLRTQTNYPIMLDACGEPRIALTLVSERRRFDAATISRMLSQLQASLEAMIANPSENIGKLLATSFANEQAVLRQWNRTEPATPPAHFVWELVEEQARRQPNATAVVCGDREWTYSDLCRSVERVADRLRAFGVGPEISVGLCVERSVELVAVLLGILKAGGAFVPLDSTYPIERLRHMLGDSGASVLVTQPPGFGQFQQAKARLISLDALLEPHGRRRKEALEPEFAVGESRVEVEAQFSTQSSPTAASRSLLTSAATVHRNGNGNPVSPPSFAASLESLAYVIYTSGSTGKPKGVMVSHRNLGSFLNAMDEVIGASPGTWLAVSRISFDISLLELLWTLTRGFKVVLQPDPIAVPKALDSTSGSPVPIGASLPTECCGAAVSAGFRNGSQETGKIDFSLFYFACDEAGQSTDKYRLLLEGAKFADRNGFAAIWTPERHFHRFGGLYPNPAVTSAALAMVTERLQLRAGSVVLPLHNPIRVVEEWAVVDNLSKGRVGLSFASGWHANDFALAPEKFSERRQRLGQDIELTRNLWRGKPSRCRNGHGIEVDVRVFPRPLQPELPIWVTASGNPETFRLAGELGANLLTNLLGQRVEELSQKIVLYRGALRKAGHDPNRGQVTLMLHTFVGESTEHARQMVRRPFIEYLKTSTDLIQKARWEFPTFFRGSRTHGEAPSQTGAHWDHEPTPSPSQEGSFVGCQFPSWEGGRGRVGSWRGSEPFRSRS